MKKKSSGTTHYCPACKSPVDRVDTVCLACESSRPPTGWPVDPYIGRTVSKKYRIDRRLSVGGFGMVFMATQVHEGQDLGSVIIKMLHPEHAFDPVVTRRFINEVKAARSLTSPHVVKIFDIDFDQGNVPFMVQEFVEGTGLADILEQDGIIEPARAVSIALQVAEGMEEAHTKNIIHRDLKPENIITQRKGRKDYAKIIDFGIARVTTANGLATTSFVGTPRYMPPEQIKGKDLDGRADIFALGVILFEMIAGQPPIKVKDSDMEYLTLNLLQEPTRLREVVPDAPASLDTLIHDMMEKDPDARPESMREVIQALEKISEEAGYIMDITGEHSIPPPAPSEDKTIRDPIRTPTFDELHEKDPQKYARHPSEDFTDERPASAQHVAEPERRGLSRVLVLAGGGAFLAVVIVAAVLFFVFGMGRGGRAMRAAGTADVEPPAGKTPAAEVATPDTSADAVPDPAGEKTIAAGSPPIEPEPVVAKPPIKKPPSKKPAVKKSKKAKKTQKDPWTKI